MAVVWTNAVGQGHAVGTAGQIVFANGPATLNGGVAVKGAVVVEGAQLQTGPGGTLYLKTVDNGFLVLRQSSKATVVTYQVDAGKPGQTRVKIDLDHGVARHISGDAVKQSRQNFRFNTPVAAIGVRGTDFTVFADAQVMRVNVNSGGIVVGALGGGCTVGGAGPCEGATSRELFAGEPNLLLQVRRGEVLPELLKSFELRPDAITPPRPDEPSDPKIGSGGGRDKPASGNKVSKTDASDLLSTELTEVGALRAQSALSQINPVPGPVVELPASREVVWGRWQPVADMPADAVQLARIRSGELLSPALVDSYFVARSASGLFKLPSEGRFAFRMTAGEAFIVDNNNRSVVGSIQNPQLEIDFVARSFATSMQVVNGATNLEVRAKGDVTLQGELLGDALRSNAVVRGQLGGATAESAHYIFNRTIDSQTRVIGGASWAR